MNNRGFTLVEVIVVSVIILILSATGMLLYNGYINDAAQKSVENIAQTAGTAANAYYRKTGVHPDSAKLNLFLSEAGRYTVAVSSSDCTVVVSDTKFSVADTVRYQ